MPTATLLHILSTHHLADDEVLVRFSDGTTAVFDSSELENLRPRRKQAIPERKIA